MVLGFPPSKSSRARISSFARGMRTAALVLVVSAVVSSISAVELFPLTRGLPIVAIADVVSLTAMAALVMILTRSSSALLALCYLVVGAVAIYLTTVAAFGQPSSDVATTSASLASAKIALILVSSPNGSIWRALIWCTSGFVAAESSSGLALLNSGLPLRFDGISCSAYVFTVMVILLGWFSQSAGIQARPLFERAARDELVFDLRHRIELNASALLHDTVLNNLAAIAASPAGPLADNMRAQLASDLETLSSEEWSSPLDTSAATDDERWRTSPLHQAVVEGRTLGLAVELTGDESAVGRVPCETASALGLAVKQCLANVARHSGTQSAEIAVHCSADELLVMVIDTGRGFVEQEVGVDRLGLRTSVRQRIDAVGGSVQIWSTPGRGTSVVIRVPLAAGVPLPPVEPLGAAREHPANPRSIPRVTGGIS